ncbi:MAG: DUF1015 domain-containing protein [Oscillospiraceae bacterium]
MGKSAFVPADILIPAGADMEDWSVIACDQFTSERDYWNSVRERTVGKLSTYHMILPEAYLNDAPIMDMAAGVNSVMESYLSAGVFETIKQSFIYVERTVTGGVRRGLVGALDLEAYDFSINSGSPVRASEKTVVERLPARMLIRESAPLELPHAMVLIDDREKCVVEPLKKRVSSMRKLYDFELMEGGGHIRGYQVSGETAAEVMTALERLAQSDVQIVIGDGNHSLAAAKELWEKIKQSLAPEQIAAHPARFALVELNNVYDPGVHFEPIHRIVFNTTPDKLLEVMNEKLTCPDGHEVEYVVSGRKAGKLRIRGKSFGSMIEQLQSFLEEYAAVSDGSIDYIHDEEAVLRLTEEQGSIGFLLPVMDKEELFSTVIADGVFPKKSFSIGHARDKRYYLECRKIK